ncbi:hypothetical protein ACOSP7_008231 [Xanthoceras sorbifolium]
MSNDLASQQLSMSSNQMGQLEPITNALDSSIQMGLMGSGTTGSLQQMSVSNMQVRPMASGYNDSVPQQMSVSNMQMGILHPMSNTFGSQMLSTTNQQTGQMEPHTYNLAAQQFFLANKQRGEIGTMSNNVVLQQLSSFNKRKAMMEPMPNYSVPQKSSISNKRVAQAEHRPWLQQSSAADKRAAQVQFMPNSPGSQHLLAPNKKVVKKESVPSKSGPLKQSLPKIHNAHMQPSVKGQTESFGSVRSKMRESLAAALALASQEQENPSNAEKDSQNEPANSPGKILENSQPARSVSTASDALEPKSGESKGRLPSKEDSSAPMCLDGQSASHENFANGNTTDDTRTSKSDGQSFHYTTLLPDEDVPFSDNFFARDELLQGNGLAWVLEPIVAVEEKKEIPTAIRQDLGNLKVGGDGDGQEQPSDRYPEIVAFEIEAELFKLFGGVNKKYKEKGRSLLFNLKDRSNPELRERVMSGEISPHRLCSMTAEELASKELSEWRMAKAEEFAQMVVLPDSDGDMRRLVKKTHKGEFQVEVEQVDTASADVSVGASSLVRASSKVNEKEAPPPSNVDGMEDESRTTAADKKSNIKDEESPCTITISSNEGTDLMQGLMVDNELKDADFLPPIVSLDEFMESLNSEPPFENLPVDADKSALITDKDDSVSGSESKSPVQSAPDPETTPSKPDNDENADVMNTKLDADMKPGNSPVKSETVPSAIASMGELVWDGRLQLNISSTVPVVGVYKSGEKTSTKEWANFMEIKGRVRLDAFEKFLQELPMSRSRAVMIVHFVGKEASPKSEHGNMSEVAESYVSDGRVGFAEPGPGFELYFCPPHKRSIDMLGKILPIGQLEALNAIDNGLIGVVVWRKAQLTSTISPNSTSHHKHSSKKQHFTSRRQYQDKDTNMNVNRTSKSSAASNGRPPVFSKQPTHMDDHDDDLDDDVPPGFGPGAGRDDDDLPEFNFAGGSTHNSQRGPRVAPLHSHPQTPSRPVDQIRELIFKYGQTQTQPQGPTSSDKRGVGVAMQPWNDDDDDDIPEWQPQAPPQHQPPPHAVHGFQRPHSHMVNQQQQIGLMQSHQQQYPPTAVTVMQGHGQQNVAHTWAQGQGTHWVPPPVSQPPVCQPSGPQYYGQPGVAWRQDAPKSRGF